MHWHYTKFSNCFGKYYHITYSLDISRMGSVSSDGGVLVNGVDVFTYDIRDCSGTTESILDPAETT